MAPPVCQPALLARGRSSAADEVAQLAGQTGLLRRGHPQQHTADQADHALGLGGYPRSSAPRTAPPAPSSISAAPHREKAATVEHRGERQEQRAADGLPSAARSAPRGRWRAAASPPSTTRPTPSDDQGDHPPASRRDPACGPRAVLPGPGRPHGQPGGDREAEWRAPPSPFRWGRAAEPTSQATPPARASTAEPGTSTCLRTNRPISTDRATDGTGPRRVVRGGTGLGSGGRDPALVHGR